MSRDPTSPPRTPFVVPGEIDALGPAAAEHARTLVHAARRRQSAALTASFENTLAIVPRPVRPIVRKIVLG